MANNNAIYNAVLAGAGGANQERWIQSADSAAYAAFRTAIEAVATAVDAAIPPDTISASQQALMQSICQGVFAGRYPQASSYEAIAASIVALYTQLSAGLQPDETPGGRFESIYRQLWLDTTKADGGNGSIGTPYNTWATAVAPLQSSGLSDPWTIFIAEDISVSGEPLPNIGAGGHDTGRVKFQGALMSSFYGADSTTINGLEIGFQDGGRIQVDFENIQVGGLTFDVGVNTLLLTGNNARIIGVSQGSTVFGTAYLVNCSLDGMAMDSLTLRMYGGTLEQDTQIADAFLYGVEFTDSTTFRWTGTLFMSNCTFKSGVQLQCSSNNALQLDLDTWGAMRAAGVTFPDTAPTLTITPWQPMMLDVPVVSTVPINPNSVQTIVVGALSTPAEPSKGCIANFGIAVNTNMSVVGSFIDSAGDLNVLVKNSAGTTQNLTNPTYTVVYLPRVSP